MNNSTRAVIQRALETAGVEFIAENGGGPGVRLQKQPGGPAAIKAEDLNSSTDE